MNLGSGVHFEAPQEDDVIRKLVLIDGQTCKEPGGSDVCLPFEQKLGASIELFAESAGRFLVWVTHADGVYVTNGTDHAGGTCSGNHFPNAEPASRASDGSAVRREEHVR